ncbi:hypothetical protein AB1K54_16065 [Microbacterium sp. BWT-B31]|uniref:hypothetical protein n=1 Tax=Microbacterium sp. BWT-B31 TaxID=3232072 RepID=UPI00352972C9
MILGHGLDPDTIASHARTVGTIAGAVRGALVDRVIDRGYFTWGTSPMQGVIAPGFGSSGGGLQIELPIQVSVLEALGILKEVH